MTLFVSVFNVRIMYLIWILILPLFILCSGIANAENISDIEACDDSSTLISTFPIPPQKYWALNRLKSHEKLLLSDPDVLLIGDSMAERWPDSDLKSMFPDMKIANFGLGSDQTQNLLWRLTEFDFASISPKIAVLWVGTNNIGSIKPCGVYEGIKAVSDKIHNYWPSLNNLIILKIAPKGSEFITASSDIKEVNSLIDTLRVDNYKNIIIDVPPGLTCGIEGASKFSVYLKRVFNDEICANYKSDNLHLSEIGYSYYSNYITGLLN